MKNVLLTLSVVAMSLFISCENNTEDPGVDCTQSNLEVSVNGTTTPGCETLGSITVEGSGGTEPYTFSVDGTNFQSSATLSELSADTYTITIKDADGCTSTVQQVLEAEIGAVTLDLVKTDSECGNDVGTITATAGGGDGSYMYSLDGGSSQTSGDFTGVSNGSHSVSVTDGDGCTTTSNIVVLTDVSLVSDVLPIITASCATSSSCHNSGASGSRPKLTTTAEVIAQADRIQFRVNSTTNPMPPLSQPQLSASEIEMINCWVDDGAQEN